MDIEVIKEPVKDNLKASLEFTESILLDSPAHIKKIIKKIPFKKGKWIRSTLLFLCSDIENAERDTLVRVGSAVEVLHLSSLIHDDIIDKSDYRRGHKTLSAVLGNSASLLTGDYLFIKSFRLISELRNSILTESVLKTAEIMVEGQLEESSEKNNFKSTEESYFRIIEKKTASLFSLICRVSAIISGYPESVAENLSALGRNIGLMFQIRDDIMDIFSRQTGKDNFQDLKEGKITLPYILLIRKAGIRKVKAASENLSDLKKLFVEYKIREDLEAILNPVISETKEISKENSEYINREKIDELIRYINSREK